MSRRTFWSRRGALVLAAFAMMAFTEASAPAATWSVMTTTAPVGASRSELHGVSCPTSSSCTAVGSFATSVGGAMAESWDGTTWSLEGVVVNPGPKNATLNGVSCVSAAVCTAVGSYGTSGGKQASLAEAKNASSPWAVQPTTDTSSPSNDMLAAVSCTTASYCVATGQHQYVHWGPTAFHWNGLTWVYEATVGTPPGYEKNGFLAGVSCPGPGTACLAAGSYGDSSGIGRTLAEAKTGATNSFGSQATPNPAGGHSFLAGISCVSTTSCVAVGRQENGSAVTPVAEVWSGVAWTLMTVPVPSGASNTRLTGVSCTTASACVAVGSYRNGSGVLVPLAERWDGSAWAAQAVPSPAGATSASFSGVSCTAIDTCVAVGAFTTSGTGNMTLAERLLPTP